MPSWPVREGEYTDDLTEDKKKTFTDEFKLELKAVTGSCGVAAMFGEVRFYPRDDWDSAGFAGFSGGVYVGTGGALPWPPGGVPESGTVISILPPPPPWWSEAAIDGPAFHSAFWAWCCCPPTSDISASAEPQPKPD
jgi:hypothetical protein